MQPSLASCPVFDACKQQTAIHDTYKRAAIVSLVAVGPLMPRASRLLRYVVG